MEMKPMFCSECGKKLDNLITGIVIMEKDGKFSTVCREHVTVRLLQGFKLSAVAKSPIVVNA